MSLKRRRDAAMEACRLYRSLSWSGQREFAVLLAGYELPTEKEVRDLLRDAAAVGVSALADLRRSLVPQHELFFLTVAGAPSGIQVWFGMNE